jgi:glutamine amidotransferase/cyclase
VDDRRVYFVHSYRATPSPENDKWVLATTEYGASFISAIQKGEINATQFHPEKSGAAGLDIIQSFLEAPEEARPAYTNGGVFQLHRATWHVQNPHL